MFIGNRASSVESLATSSTRSRRGMDTVSDAARVIYQNIQTPAFPFSISWTDDTPPGLFPDIQVNNTQSTLPPLDDLTPSLFDFPDHFGDPLAEMDRADLVFPDDEEEKPVVQELLCTDHGISCKKSLCKTYAKQLREAERAKRMAENSERSRGRGKGIRRGHHGRGGINSNWQHGFHGGGQETDQPPAGPKNPAPKRPAAAVAHPAAQETPAAAVAQPAPQRSRPQGSNT
jgi:hypothetical protein